MGKKVKNKGMGKQNYLWERRGTDCRRFKHATLYCHPYVLVAQSGLTFCNPMDFNPPGSFVHGIFQARILQWVAIPFTRRYS